MNSLIKEYINEIIIALFGAIGTYLVQRFFKYLKKRKITLMLRLKKGDSNIFIPIRNREFKTNVDNVYESSSVYQDDLIIYNEVLILYEIKKIIDEMGKKSNLKICKNRDIFDTGSNAFYFGGYEVHEYVRDVFCDKFPNVKFTCPERSYNKWKDEKIKKILEITTDTYKRHIKVNGKEILEYDTSKAEGYIVLIKRTGKIDFGSAEYGTEHICFGNNATTALSIAKCFNDHRDTLYRYLRKRKHHYFIVAKCERDGRIIFDSIKDLTEDVFKKN